MHDLNADRRRRWSSIPALANVPMETLVTQMDDSFSEMCACIKEEQAKHGLVEFAHVDPAVRSVRYKQAATRFSEPFGQADAFMKKLLAKNAAGRDELMMLFGDCETLVHITQMISKLWEILPAHIVERDTRLKECEKSCVSVQAVLEENGLGERFRARIDKEKKKVDDMVSRAGNMAEASMLVGEAEQQTPSGVAEAEETTPGNMDEAEVSLPPQLVRVTTTQRQQLLREIDDLIDDPQTKPQAHAKLDVLFEHYASGAGFIVAPAYQEAIVDVTKYVKMEWDARNERYTAVGKRSLGKFGDVQEAWVKGTVDVDGDECITRSEAMQGFLKCVKDIE